MFSSSSALLHVALACLLVVAPLSAGAKDSSKKHPTKTCLVVPPRHGADAGPAIIHALSPSQCGTNGKVILNGFYPVDTVLYTTGLKNVEIELTGTVQYSTNIPKWSNTSIYMTYQNATTAWFLSGTNINLHGGPHSTGTIDGNGQTWWDAYHANPNSGAAGGSSRTFARPVPLTIGNATNVIVSGISVVQSPFWSNFVYSSRNVTYDGIRINSTSNNASVASANSDGWDIYRSDHITIKNSLIHNSDDCVSFKPNSTNIVVSNLDCTGSHGISVGSLGQYAGETDIVANVSVNGIRMTNAQNGARIKVWAGSADPQSITGGGLGYVKNITFANFVNTAVDHPIVIDQCYFGTAAGCLANPSKLTISDVHYYNVTGTGTALTVASLSCSATCEDITATGTHLSSLKNGTAVYVCKNVASAAELDFPCTAAA